MDPLITKLRKAIMRAEEEGGRGRAREEAPRPPHTLGEGDLAVAEAEEGIAIVAEIINISLHSINRPRESTSKLLTSNRQLVHLQILMIITIRIKTIVRNQTSTVKKRLKTTITKVATKVPQPMADSIQDKLKRHLTMISMREDHQSTITREEPILTQQVVERATKNLIKERVIDKINTRSLKSSLKGIILSRRNLLTITQALKIIRTLTATQSEEAQEVEHHAEDVVAIKAEVVPSIIHLTKGFPSTRDPLSQVKFN